MARRNSSLELMRIIAMLMIIARHYVNFNAFNVGAQQFSLRKVILEGIFFPAGKIGVVLFFAITAYFLCMKDSFSVKSSIRKAWLLEREVIFWSLTLLGLCLIVWPEVLTPKWVIASFMPISSGLWWYATSYILFLLAFPFVTYGLRALGRRMHAYLCIAMIVLWVILAGFASIFTLNYVSIRFDMSPNNVIIFIFLYTLIAYYRWYMKECSVKTAIGMIVAGTFLLIGESVVFGLLFQETGRWGEMQTYWGNAEWNLPVILVSAGLFVLFNVMYFSNRVVDSIAKSMFAVYLIHLYPPIQMWLWQHEFDMNRFWHSRGFWLYTFLAIFGVLVVCVVADYVRRGLFAITVNRHPGRWFDALWNKFHRTFGFK